MPGVEITPSPSKLVLVNDLGAGVFEMRLNDRVAQNRLSDQMCGEMMSALANLKAEPSLKVLLLTGLPEVFCSGAPADGLDRLFRGEIQVMDFEIPELLIGFPVPVVAALEGHAVGGGLALSLCCDVTVASEDARYSLNFTSMGFTPGLGTTTLLPAAIGHQRALEMILTAKFYRGAELKTWGLFSHVVPGGQVRELALDIAERMADKPRYVLEMIKDTLSVSRRQTLREGMSREHLMHRICFQQPDIRELITDNYIGASIDASKHK